MVADDSDDGEYILLQDTLYEMMQGEGWLAFRKSLLIKREDQMKRFLSITPNENGVPLYADARAKVQLFDELLSCKPSDILDVIRDYTNE